ncbi:MAG TPA: MDR family MFS transporter [Candidatus Dormibacteraeota bacterium]
MEAPTRTQAPSGGVLPAGGRMIDLDHRSKMVILGAVMLGLFLATLDQTIVGTALPRITTDLGGSDQYTWVVTAYLLTSTITVPVYGKLSDVYGRKPLLLIGISLFVVGSALCGASQNIEQLIAFRALQGLGAGSLFPISLAVIGDLFSPRERGRYQGLFGAVFGVSFIIGPFIGGVLTDQASWRWVFYVNVPVALAALAVIATVLPNMRRLGTRARDLDYLGVAVFSAGMVPLLIGLNNKGTPQSNGGLPGWTDAGVGPLLALAVVLLGLFVLVEARAREPIVPLSLFRIRTYTVSVVATLAMATALFAGIIYLPRFYQAVRGQGATESGYQTWPLILGLILSSVVAGRLISSTGKYKRMLMATVGLLLVGMLSMTRLTTDTSTATLWLSMAVIGVGVGPGMSAYTTVVQSVAPRHLLGVATSTLTFFRQVGGSVGLAIAGTIFNQRFHDQLPAQLDAHGVPPEVRQHLGGQLTGVGQAGLAQSIPPAQQHLVPNIIAAIHDSFSTAVGAVFWVGVVGAVVAVAAVFFLPELPLRGSAELSPDTTPQTEADDVPVPAATPARSGAPI